MNPIRVLHVVGGYPTPAKPYHQIFIKTQVDSLVAAGICCEVLHLQGPGFRKYVTGWRQVHRHLRQEEFDLIHAHYAYCGAVALGHGLPVITSFLGSDLYGVPRNDGSYPLLSSLFHRRLSRTVADHSADGIVKSQRMRDDLAREVHVVPNGVDLAVFKPVSSEERVKLRCELGLDADTYYVLFAGNKDFPHKRFPLAEQAFTETKRQVSRPMELLVLSGRPHGDVVKHMQACDMLVLSSSHEGSPNVIKEAMAAGMAVVAVDVGDTRERLAGVSGCRVIDNDSPAALSAAMSELVSGAEPSGGPEAVVPLAMETVARRIEEIYQTVLQARGR